MTQAEKDAISVYNILDILGLEGLDCLCAAFLEDFDVRGINPKTEWLIPYIFNERLKYYEKEY